MKWNAFLFLEDSMQHTKNLLFPVNVKYWLKLGFVSLLTPSNGGGSGRGFRSSNFDIPGRTDKGTGGITGNTITDVTNTFGHGLIGAAIIVLALLALLFTFITSIFSFIFLEALTKKQYNIGKGWDTHHGKGTSLFGFRVIAGIISVVITGILLLPLFLAILKTGIAEFINSPELFTTLLAYLPLFLLVILWLFVFGVFMTFVFDFSLPEMYKNHIGIREAIRRTFKLMKKQKVESLVYILARWIYGILTTIIAVIVALIFIILVGIVSLIIFVPLFYLSIVAGVVILIPYVLFMLYILVVLLLPLTVFMKYFTLLGYEKLFGVTLVSKNTIRTSKTKKKKR